MISIMVPQFLGSLDVQIILIDIGEVPTVCCPWGVTTSPQVLARSLPCH